MNEAVKQVADNADAVKDQIRRFWAMVAKQGPEDCWLWTGGRYVGGYGCFWFGSPKRLTGAHRVAWRIVRGRIPDGMHVLHQCDTKACVNPAHLFIGTNDDNIADKCAKGRQTIGERHPNARLTEAQISEIRLWAAEHQSEPKLRLLAERFGVGRVQISRIIRRKRWRHIP